MKEKFPGAEITGNRTEDSVLEEVEGRIRAEVRAQDLEPREGEHVEFALSHDSGSDVDSEQDLAEYLNESSGFQTAKVVLTAEGRVGKHSHSISEDVTMRLRFNSREFQEVYTAIDENFDVKAAGFSFKGYGETAPEAYRDAAPRVSFLAYHQGDPLGATAVYRDDDLVLENIWSDAEDKIQPLYDSLKESGAEYDGVVIEDVEEEDEWMIGDHGTVNVFDRR